MTATVLDIQGKADHEDALAEAKKVLGAGGLVVIPTETVYGLAANALDPEAMARLRTLKVLCAMVYSSGWGRLRS